MKKSAMQTFIDNINRIRSERGMTQADLAAVVGTKQPSVSKILRGEEEMTLSRAEKWAEALGVELAELVSPNILVK
jgi:transcriptional regulator with XRE-family HTH domain